MQPGRSPVSFEGKSIQTSSMPSAWLALPPQALSLGWKIQARCFSSSVPHPSVSTTARTAAEKAITDCP